MRMGSVIVVGLLVVPALAGDWSQWRGQNRDGHSTDTALLREWPKDGPKLLWSIKDPAAIGVGYGTPAVVGNRMYLLGADGPKQGATEFVTCLNLKDGERIWQTKLQTSAGRFSDGWGGGPRSTPLSMVIDSTSWVSPAISSASASTRAR
ncbi:MAG: hypothetical protein U0840_09650 [Gemmataceae bacterium]